eukprot:894251_1
MGNEIGPDGVTTPTIDVDHIQNVENKSAPCTHLVIPQLHINTKNLPRTSYLTKYKGATPMHTNSITHGLCERPFSDRLAESAANFWSFVERLSIEDRLEIAVHILINFESKTDKVYSKHLPTVNKQETHAIKLLDMIGFIIRCISNDNASIISLLSRLGLLHQNLGIKPEYYPCLLTSIHETFEHYLPEQYQPEIKFAFESVFKWTSEKMMKETSKCWIENDLSFLTSFEECMKSNVGRNCLCNFLVTQWCDEMAVFLLLLHQFKKHETNTGRYLIGKKIIELCIENEGKFVINIAYDIRYSILDSNKWEKK